MKKRKKKFTNKLESKVMKINSNFILSDHQGRYIPYCDFGYHEGLIIREYVCKQRHCKHYYKLYIERK